MPALSHAAYDIAFSNHNQLERRMLNLFQIEVRAQEVYEALVPEEDRVVLKRAKELGCKSSVFHHIVSFNYGSNRIKFDLSSVEIIPRSLAVGYQTITPSMPFAERVTTWADNVIDVYRRFERGKKVLEMLHEKCASAKQVRYFLPGIVTLLSMSGGHHVVNKLTTASPLRNPPILPSGSRQAIMDYNALIAQASLLPERSSNSSNVQFEFLEVVKKPWE